MQTVAYGTTNPAYNQEPPFHPDTHFPELPFQQVSRTPNAPYGLLRRLFASLGFDAERRGTAKWNPLGHLIKPGQTVLIKPNFVLSFNAAGGDVFSVVTHPSILRALVDYAFLALCGMGRIIIADVPQMECQWDELMHHQRLDSIQEFYANQFKFPIEVYDLRNFALINPRELALAGNRKNLAGDPAGSVVINLGRRSHFHGLPNENHYGADFNRQETIAHHHGETQEYCVSRTMLAADVLLFAPKMKTHKKVGVTLNIKGLVGMNTNKNYLIHYRLGTPSTGGDQLPDAERGAENVLVRAQRWAWDNLLARQSSGGDRLYRAAVGFYRKAVKPFIRLSNDTVNLDGGNWHGNDSAWRMTADLAKILYYADVTGKLAETPQRKLFCLVDGIIAGEGFGPLSPVPRPCGCLVAGLNPFAVDLVTTRLMGFDPRKLHQFDIAFSPDWDFGLRSLGDIEIHDGERTLAGADFFAPERRDPHFAFTPSPGWKGHIEI